MIATLADTTVTCFALPKRTGTYADALAAFGLQRLLYLLSGVRFTVSDGGSEFVLTSPSQQTLNVDVLDYEAVRRAAGYPYVRLPGDKTPKASEEIDYAAERMKLLAWREASQAIAKEKRRPTDDERDRLNQLAPMPNWSLYQNVNVLQGFGSYVSLHREIRQSDSASFRVALRNRLASLMIPIGNLLIGAAFAGKVTAVQAYNPSIGKGTSGAKPSGSGLAGLPGFFVNWFDEWLRYIGVGVAARSLALDKDIKMYVLAPTDMRLTAVQQISGDFIQLPSGFSSAKADVQLAIGLARALIRHSGLTTEGGDDTVGIRRRRPSDLIAGLHTAYFKSLGQSRSLSNISFIGLPGWFPVDQESVKDWLDVLDDHERILRPLDEKRTEEANLLARYRDFLSAGPELISALLTFQGDYAIHVFRILDRGRPVATPRLAVLDAFLRRLFMDQRQDLAPILDDTGFRHVAAAIRRATVSEQFQKAHQQQEYEIRYGLLQELQRKARFKDQFVVQLSDFIVGYNHENARKAEMAASSGRALRRRRPQVTTEDVARVVSLLDTYPSETVAMLLLAYAAASDPRTPATTVEAATDTGEAAAGPETMGPDGATQPDADESAE